MKFFCMNSFCYEDTSLLSFSQVWGWFCVFFHIFLLFLPPKLHYFSVSSLFDQSYVSKRLVSLLFRVFLKHYAPISSVARGGAGGGRKISRNWTKNQSQIWRRPFFFFWRPPNFGRKKPLISAEKSVANLVKTFFFFFLWRPPNFGRKKPLNHSQFW